VALALTLAPVVSSGQTMEQAAAGTGTLDVGVRVTKVTGDGARYERYRNLSDGLYLEGLRWDGRRSEWLFSITADHVGYTDQRYLASATRPGRVKAWFLWDQVPMLMSASTRTLFVEAVGSAPARLTLDPAFRSQVQAGPASAPVTTQVAALFGGAAQTFETSSRRDIAQGGLEVIARPDLTLRALFQRTDRSGVVPYGASFGHGSLVELPAPIAHTLDDFETSAEFERDRVLLRAGVSGSWFTNANATVSFENPFRTFDAVAAGSCTVAVGIVAPCSSAASQGRLSLSPSHSFVTLNGLASVKLARRSRATWSVSMGSLRDAGAAIMPQTINAVNAPLIAPLPRDTVDGRARTLATNLHVVSRPHRAIDVTLRVRTYEYDNRTPEFAMTQRVAYDNAPGVASMSTLGGVSVPGPVPTEAYGVTRHALEADVRFTPVRLVSAGLGVSRLSEERSHRFFEETTDHVVRLTFDALGSQRLTLRAKYEHAERRGEATDEARRALFNIGEHPEIRHFDIASRDRDRLTVLGWFTPMASVAVTASAAVGQDDFLESVFGLRDNHHRVYSVGVEATPAEGTTVGLSYSFERYNALSRSRQASPPSGTSAITYEQYVALTALPATTVQVADASRNWATDSEDRAHSVIASLDLLQIRDRFDVRIAADVSRARTVYTYVTGPVPDRTLPEETVVDTTLTNCLVPSNCSLPPVISRLARTTTDLTYWIRPALGLGLSHWFERYQVSDFTLDTDATPDLVRSQAVLVGYLYRPYRANTVFARLIVRW
jgi:hypothetical protein